MRILPGDGVTSTALANGQITLRTVDSTNGFRCTPLASAMWFALRHNDGFVDLAIDALTHVWETDREKVRTVMDAWTHRLIAEGWLQTAP